MLGVALLLAPVPARLKEWAYAGFAINIASAHIAHISMGEGADALIPSAATSVLWVLSYFLWRRREARSAGIHAPADPIERDRVAVAARRDVASVT